MTGQDLIKEILMFVPEVRGSVDTVKAWINQAIRDIESVEDWEYMIRIKKETAASEIQSPLDMSSDRPKRVFDFFINGKQLTPIEPFSEFSKIALGGSGYVFYGLENDRLHWRPATPIAAGTSYEIRFYARSAEVDENTNDNWLLNNAYSLVKYKTLMHAAAYTKNVDMLQQFGGLYQLELDTLRSRFGIMTAADKQLLAGQQQAVGGSQ